MAKLNAKLNDWIKANPLMSGLAFLGVGLSVVLFGIMAVSFVLA